MFTLLRFNLESDRAESNNLIIFYIHSFIQ